MQTLASSNEMRIIRHNFPGETMKIILLFAHRLLTENTSTPLPSSGLDTLFFPFIFEKKPLIEGLFFGLSPNASC